MAVSAEYREWVVEQLRHVGPVTGRSMFGGYCLYLDGSVFALIDDDTLYFKTGSSNRADYEAAGMAAFRPFGDDAPVMGYHEVPADVLEDPDRLRQWANKALDVSRAARRKKRK